MKLSIIIPAYNAEKQMEECLNSVKPLIQSIDEDMEILVVDDGSSDHTLEKARKIMEQIPCMKIIEKENGGVSSARNAGLEDALGQWVMFLDADDVLCEEGILSLTEALKGEEDFQAFSYYTWYPDGTLELEALRMEAGEEYSMEKMSELVYASSTMNTCWGKLFKKMLLQEKNILFDEKMKIGEDALFVMEYFSYCKSVHLIQKPLIKYLQNPESAMHSQNLTQKTKDFDKMYAFRKRKVASETELYKKMCAEHFSVLTDLFRQAARTKSYKNSCKLVRELLEGSVGTKILGDLKKEYLSSPLKKMEAGIVGTKSIWLITLYFKIKGKLRR